MDIKELIQFYSCKNQKTHWQQFELQAQNSEELDWRDYICQESWLFKGITLGMLTQRTVGLERMQFKSQKAAAYHCKQPQEKNNMSILRVRRSLSSPRVARVSFIVSVSDTGSLETSRIITTQRFVWEVCLDLKCYFLSKNKIHTCTCKRRAQT